MADALSSVKRFIFWDYQRGGWQYDVMVGVILAFIFLVPREWFRDQPRASSVVMLPAAQGQNAFWIEPVLLEGVPPAEMLNRASAVLGERTHKKQSVVRIDPILDSEKETVGYLAYARP
jgi:hypothetical protein